MKYTRFLQAVSIALLSASILFTPASRQARAEDSVEREYGQVTSSDVNLRVEPNTECDIITKLALDTRLEVLAYDNGWYRVLYEDSVGYIRGDYLFVNTNGTRGAYVLEDGVNLYGGPSSSSYIIKELTGGQGIKVKAMIGEWCFALIGDSSGYVRYDKLRMTRGSTAEENQLRMGMEGADIRKLQQELYDRGFLSKADITGLFGAKTRTAVLEFQELANLSVDGIVGSETLNAVYDSGNNIRKENAVFNQVKGTVELLDWFKGGSEWMAKGKNFTITDVRTGLSFRVRRFGGWYHADSVPLTAADTKIMFEISNNSWSWNRRPIWVTSGGRTVAASMHTMPHLSNPIPSNNFGGHFCIHLYNSKVHENSKACPRHQSCVQEAYLAGRPQD